jgi:hypothetical protein
VGSLVRRVGAQLRATSVAPASSRETWNKRFDWRVSHRSITGHTRHRRNFRQSTHSSILTNWPKSSGWGTARPSFRRIVIAIDPAVLGNLTVVRNRFSDSVSEFVTAAAIRVRVKFTA